MAPQLFGIRPFHNACFRELFERNEHSWLPNAGARLQRLDEKLGLDHSAQSGFEIELIRGAAAVAADSFEHGIDLRE